MGTRNAFNVALSNGGWGSKLWPSFQVREAGEASYALNLRVVEVLLWLLTGACLCRAGMRGSSVQDPTIGDGVLAFSLWVGAVERPVVGG